MVEGSARRQPRQPRPLLWRRLQRLLKKLIDYLGAGFLLVLTLPLWVIVALAVRWTSPGPALFRQERLGKNQHPFIMYKFRSMVHRAPEEPHRAYIAQLLADEPTPDDDTQRRQGLYKLDADPRITPIGNFLRQSSLDELPQLLNVLRGEASLVGPRPVLAYEVEHYTAEMLERFEVEPGITGLWQVSGRSSLSYRQMVALDVDYVRRWSLLLDVKILVATVGVVLWGRGRAR